MEYLGNVVGGRPVLYCNVPMAELKKYAALTILKGEVSYHYIFWDYIL